MVFVKKLEDVNSSPEPTISDIMEEQVAAANLSDPIEDYLRSWGLEMYIDTFKEHSIDLETLPMLSTGDIKELIPVIGHRAKLTTQIASLKNIITDAFISESSVNKKLPNIEDKNEDTVCVIDVALLNDADREQSYNLDAQIEQDTECELYNTLSSCNEGKGLLLCHQENGLLDNTSRRRLCNLIISHELKDDPEKRITSSRLYQMAYEITKVFKKESSSVYFIPFARFSPHHKISAKGKLLDCYRQRRRDFIKSGIIKAQDRRSSSASSHSGPASPCPSTSTQEAVLLLEDYQETDINEKLLWLKNCCDPWEMVETCWTVTTKKRLGLLQSNLTIQEYYTEFKALNQPGGIFLILKDYKSLYPGNEQKLTENWHVIRPKIIELAKKRSDAFLKEIMKDVENEQTEEIMDLAAFIAIAFLMTTSNMSKTTSKSKRLWRPSKQEVLEGFINHVKSAAQIEESIARRIQKLREYDLTLQPFIIIVGPSIREIFARYIVVNNVRYEVTCIKKAVDACFKIIFVLNAQYPAECIHVWQLIQIALFHLKTKYDKIYTTVNTLITDLNIQQE